MYGFATFLPSILTAMGHNHLEAQYLTIPVHLTGGIFFLTCALLSDKLLMRSPFMLFANCFGIAGYGLILLPTSNEIKYFGTFLCAIGAYTGVGLNITWLSVNVAPHFRRATALGLALTIGNTCGVAAGQIYRSPPYVLGNSLSLASLGVAQALILTQWWYLRRCNRLKAMIANGDVPDTRRVKTGDWELDFTYHL